MGWRFPQSLGGNLGSTPIPVSWGPGRLDIFWIDGNTNQLQHTSLDNDHWNGIESLGGNLQRYDPSAVSYTAGRLDVFGIDANANELQHWWYIDGFGWGGPKLLGGNLKYGVSAVSWDVGTLAVFGVDTNTNSLQVWSWDEESARHGAGWGGPDSLGGNLVSSLSAVSWAAGRLDIFGADGNTNQLQWWWWDGSWGGPVLLGGNLGSAPSAVSWAPGRLDIFAIDTTSTLQHWLGYNPTSEYGWEGPNALAQPDGGTVGSEPTAVTWGPYRLDVFAAYAGANQPLHWWADGFGRDGWGGPELLTGNWCLIPGAVTWGPNRLDVFGTDIHGGNQLAHWVWLP